MTGVEITLILVGIIFVLVSFFVQEKLTPERCTGDNQIK